MAAPASTGHRVGKRAVKRHLADRGLTRKQPAQTAGIAPGAPGALIRCRRDLRAGSLFALADAMRMDPRGLVEKADE